MPVSFAQIAQLKWCLLVVALVLRYGSTTNDIYSNKTFPKGFLFGTAIAAYQSEGAWNVSGRRESIWDHFVHTRSQDVLDHSNGDTSCDFYHKYKDDIKNLKFLGVQYLRMSISWARILPCGTIHCINWSAIEFYRKVFIELLENGIEPMVTIYHWDLPQVLQVKGGFASKHFVRWFEDYARLAFQEFGDLIKMWSTFNEPQIYCLYGYGAGIFAPGIEASGTMDYICGHNLLKAHAAAYHVYDKEFRYKQRGKIGIVMVTFWAIPASHNQEDIEAAETFNQFMLGWFSHPIFIGDYPQVMKDRVGKRSLLEGRNQSRLPEFTEQEVRSIRGTHDYYGLNQYTAILASAVPEPPVGEPDYYLDIDAEQTVSPDWGSTCSDRMKVVPGSMREILVYVKKHYGNPPIYIMENGYCDFGELEDDDRVSYIRSYLSSLRDAMVYDNVDVRSYTVWSYMDSFEWSSGYAIKFGLFYVNFTDPALPRIPKKSAYAYKKIIKMRCLVDNCD